MFAIAYCDRTGVIRFAEDDNKTPDGVIVFASGEKEELEEAVNAKARHGYSAGVLLVPGVPEASNENEAFDAFMRWRKWAFPKHAWKMMGDQA
jgi:hypothetical protein